MKVFEYQLQNGILRHFYNRGNSYYYRNIKIKCSSYVDSSKTAEKAFDFINSTHWIGNEKLPNQTISFCFNSHYEIFVSEYEITTSQHGSRPKIWSFAGSLDGSSWKNNEEYQYYMATKEVKRVAWNHGPYRCFRFMSIASTDSSYTSFDLSQTEIFGIIAFKGNLTCKTKSLYPLRCILYIILLLK